MSPRFNQLFYRAAFILLCVAPTVYTIGLIAERKIVSAAASLEAASKVPEAALELSRHLGVTVTLGNLSYKPKHITVLTDVQLHDPETGKLLAAADSVEMYFAQDGTLAIEPVGVTLQADQLSRLAAMLHGRVLRELPAGVKVAADCAKLQLVGGTHEETLARVKLTIEHAGENRQAVAEFRPAWKPNSKPLQLEIVRHNADPQPFTSLAFHTGEESLPASWFEFVLPSLARLGDACHLQGTLATSEHTTSWETTFSGVLRGLELDRLVVRRLRPYALGTATMQIDHARWRGGRLVDAAGLLESESLQLSWGTIAEAFVALGIEQQPVLSEQSWRNSVATSQGRLHCRFTLDASGLSMLGKNGIILHDADQPLFHQPQQKLAWTGALVNFCSELGVPPLEVMPLGSYPKPSGVRLRE